MIGPYRSYIIQQKKGKNTIKDNISITCIKIIEPTTGWFEISEVSMFDLDDVMGGNDEYIDKSSVRVVGFILTITHLHKMVGWQLKNCLPGN